ncbi:bacterio-opsin activator domain-containing protein [Haladaptatus sp. DFWS20]|uniref:bacterio-opsin activator domain-containing protein n=1 Tax=Haladaptatus sp. DFWS20 TaxID=3403467 RepID=UPI003EBEB1DB
MTSPEKSATSGTVADDTLLTEGDDGSTFFRTVVADAGQPIFTLDTSGVIVYANRAVGDLFGYDVDALIGSHMRTFFPPEYADAYCEDFEAAVHGTDEPSESIHRTTLERTGYTADGETLPLRFSFTEQTYENQRVFTVIIRNLTERKAQEQQHRDSEARFRQIAERIDSVLWMADADLSEVLYVNSAYEDVWGRTRESLYEDLRTYIEAIHPDDRPYVEKLLEQMMRDSRGGTLQSDYTTEYRIVQPDETVRWISDRSFPVYDDDGEIHRFVGVAQDITAQKHREEALTRQYDILQTISEINTVLRQVNKSMVEATTQAEIESFVCEHLASSELYQAAIITDFEPATEGITIRTTSGVEDEYLDAIRMADPTDTEQGAAARAIETGDTQVVDDIRTDAGFPASVRDAALSQGYRSAICVPLVYGETIYGVLVVYGSKSDLFSDRERAIFDELGSTLGYAIYAIKTQQLLFTDRVVELEFDLTDTDAYFPIASGDLDCTFVLDAVVPTSTGRLLYYVTANDIQPEEVVGHADQSPRVKRARCICTHAESSRFEFLFKGGKTASQRFIELGAHIHAGYAADGTGSLTIRAPATTEVRPFVDVIHAVYPRAHLAAKHEFDRSIDSPTEFRTKLQQQLTDRQLEVVQMAYHSGYFESPRKSTGEELAATLDISAPTFHQHLQAAHRKLLMAIFMDSSDVG